MMEEKRSFQYIFGFRCEGALYETGYPVSLNEQIKRKPDLEVWEQLLFHTISFNITIGKTVFQFELQQCTEIGIIGDYYVIEEVHWTLKSKFSGRKRALDRSHFFKQLWTLLRTETKFCDVKCKLSFCETFIRKLNQKTIIS